MNLSSVVSFASTVDGSAAKSAATFAASVFNSASFLMLATSPFASSYKAAKSEASLAFSNFPLYFVVRAVKEFSL